MTSTPELVGCTSSTDANRAKIIIKLVFVYVGLHENPKTFLSVPAVRFGDAVTYSHLMNNIVVVRACE